MARHNGSNENKLRGYKAAAHNPRNSDEAKRHAEEEVNKLSNSGSDEERHEENVKRGLKAAVHNPRVTEGGKRSAKNRLDEMGEPAE